ncbi:MULTISPECIES: SDR family NAD(P)-dependent oxidoreductase [unclassified Moraxella]|uniref:SDR family NAD(P)-dependent oxidoreductase n=1 Tax=unclassified Moraxella TaxID=2685852 RepID=UPI003AF7B986
MNILITGVTSGFGKQIAIDFINKGHTVISTGRRADKLDDLKTQLGENFIPLAFDIADLTATQTALQSLPSDLLQHIDVLVNNAGLALGLETADKADISDWQQMINTNTLGLVNITHAILPSMVANNDGYIINISSIAGNYPYLGGNVYGATKAFVTQFSLNLRADLLGKMVRVTNIEPGLCGGTEFSNVRFHGDDAKAQKVYENVQFVTPQDIANMVMWLVEQPKHVNINRIEVMPTAQTFAGLTVFKG